MSNKPAEVAKPKREQWGGRFGFVLATAGSAVGLGNIMKFPYMTGANGGAAFLFVYIIVMLIVGAVMLLAAMGCSVLRLLKGPHAQDRVLALDCMYLNGMLAMLVMGILYDSMHYFEAALLVALFGCVGSTAMAKFLLRGEVIE